MVAQKSLHRKKREWGVVAFTVIIAGMLAIAPPAEGISAADQDSAMAAYIQSFWDSGRKVLKITNDNTTAEKFWTSVNEWQMIMDAWERSGNPAYLAMISDFYTGFCTFWATKTSPAGTLDWLTIQTDSDGAGGVGNFNDDMIWAVQACARAYMITGNNAHRAQAKSIFDKVWVRAYDNVIGGGVYWNTTNDYKSSCVNFPLISAAVYLADGLGDTSYLSKAKSVYAWAKLNLINTSNGAVYDGKRPNGSIGATTYTYNQGAMIGAAQMLFKKTRDSAYYRDALLAANYGRRMLNAPGTDVLKNENNDYNQPGFKGILALYMAKFAQENNLAVYRTWLQHMAASVYEHRGPGNNLTYKNFAEYGAGAQHYAWEAYGGCNLMQVIPADPNFINLTANKPATSNGFVTGADPAKAVDRSVAAGSLWQGNATGDKWLSVDCGANCTISRWEVQHAAAGGGATNLNTRIFRLQRSTNGTTWYDADTILGNASNQTIRDFASSSARYVRLYVTQSEQSGNSAARIYEFTVFGTAPTRSMSDRPQPAPAMRWSISRSDRGVCIRITIPASRGRAPGMRLGIYDLSGHVVKTLIDDPVAAGSYMVIYDGGDASGCYLCRMRTGDIDKTEKILFVR